MNDAPPAPHESRGFAVGFRLDAGCLRVHVTGALGSLEEILALFLAVAAELRRTGAAQMLMIDDTRRDVPDAAQFGLLVQAVDGAGFAGVRLAYVSGRGGEAVPLEANELLARERGYVLKVFGDEMQALLWLRYGVD